jgi:hypothetical protein
VQQKEGNEGQGENMMKTSISTKKKVGTRWSNTNAEEIIRKKGITGGGHRTKNAHFDCMRHNIRREWLKWRELGASG